MSILNCIQALLSYALKMINLQNDTHKPAKEPLETLRGLTAKERYECLIRARNFHYENFNKWMTYFYVAIGATFVGYCSLSNNMDKSQGVILILTLLGYLISLFWHWSCKGYYYWNINFITLVNHCEINDLKLKPQHRVYAVFANKKNQNKYLSPISGANISTSKTAILFSFIVSIAFGILFIRELAIYIEKESLFDFSSYYYSLKKYKILSYPILSLVVTLVFGLIPKWCLKSKIDHFPDLEIKQENNK